MAPWDWRDTVRGLLERAQHWSTPVAEARLARDRAELIAAKNGGGLYLAVMDQPDDGEEPN